MEFYLKVCMTLIVPPPQIPIQLIYVNVHGQRNYSNTNEL